MSAPQLNYQKIECQEFETLQLQNQAIDCMPSAQQTEDLVDTEFTTDYFIIMTTVIFAIVVFTCITL